ncbi:MAG: hypothetical protein AMXMBFR82_52150 [Candidatus Hydrogenedentota bacterium]
MDSFPIIIQGGMGAAVSHWPLARAVSKRGHLGVVSGTALATVVCRRLQAGDVGGHIRRALEQFPWPPVAERVLSKWYVPGGLAAGVPFKRHSMYSLKPSVDLLELTVTSAFAEVHLAKEGHDGVVGLNLLEKILLPNLSTLYGAILAGVDYVLMGAGIPLEIPGALDRLSNHETARLRVPVTGAEHGEEHTTEFDPRKLIPGELGPLKRPKFLAIISSAVLAVALVKKSTGRVDGFIVEGPTAGGHNAPPRAKDALSPTGEPVYGPKDSVDLEKIKAHGLPFWLAGSYGAPERVREALELGAQGVQVGTAFAFCEESGFTPEIKEAVLRKVAAGEVSVFTDPVASPTGFPFKVTSVPGSLSEADEYKGRTRICDLGYLRQVYKRSDGSIGHRCSAEPQEDYVKKGGSLENTEGRKCLCNALSAAAGFGQIQKSGDLELPLVTAGDGLTALGRFLKNGSISYTADDVLDALEAGIGNAVPAATGVAGS